MKIIFILIITLAVSATSQAQSNHKLTELIPEKFLQIISEKLINIENIELNNVLSNSQLFISNPAPLYRMGSGLAKDYTLQLWSGANWDNDSSIVYNYNPNNLLAEILYRDWLGSQWVNKYRILYYYDSAFRISILIGQDNSTGSWIDTTKKEYSYDGQGQLSSINTFRWNDSSWENSRLTTYTYINNFLIREIIQEWSGSSWENSLKLEALYNSNYQLTNIVTSIWVIGFWLDLFQFVLYYNTAGYIDELRLQYWDFTGWGNLARTIYTFDNNYNIIESKMQDWDSNTSSWINDYRIISTYHQNNLINTSLRELWSTNNNWVNESFKTYSYDANFNRTKVLMQIWNLGNWINSTRELYNYIVTSVEEINQTPRDYFLTQNYPNPFNPTTTIKFSFPSSGFVTLKIYNALGEQVAVLLDKELTTDTYEVEWNAAGLPSGVYFYQLKSERYVETKKMIFLK